MLGLRVWDSRCQGRLGSLFKYESSGPRDCPQRACGAFLPPHSDPGKPTSCHRGASVPVGRPPLGSGTPEHLQSPPPGASHLSAALAASQGPEPWASAASPSTLGPGSARPAFARGCSRKQNPGVGAARRAGGRGRQLGARLPRRGEPGASQGRWWQPRRPRQAAQLCYE